MIKPKYQIDNIVILKSEHMVKILSASRWINMKGKKEWKYYSQLDGEKFEFYENEVKHKL